MKFTMSVNVSGIFTEGIFTDGIFAEGIFAKRNFRRTEFLPSEFSPNGIFAENQDMLISQVNFRLYAAYFFVKYYF